LLCYTNFCKSNRQWHAKNLAEPEIDLFKKAIEQSSIKKEHIIAHATYLINLASPHDDMLKKSIAALKEELIRCSKLEIPYLVLHPGSSLTASKDAAIKQVAISLEDIFSDQTITTNILLETMAGQGSVICSTFEEIGHLINLCPTWLQKKIGVCLDTCHIFAAGYSFNTS
jgi:deoxyribonuclease-4